MPDPPALLGLSRSLRRVLGLGLCLLCFLLAPASRLPAQDPAPVVPASGVGAATPSVQVSSIQQFWDLNAAAKAEPVGFDLDCWVTYYDPEWKSLWVQDTRSQSAAYVPTGDKVLDLRSGQRIRAVGRTAGGEDISFRDAVLTVLGEGAPTPLPLEGDLFDAQDCANMLVETEAIIDRVEPFGPSRLHLYLNIAGRLVYAWYHYNPAVPLPRLAHSRVRLSGVYTTRLNSVGPRATIELMVGRPEQIRVLCPLEADTRFDGQAVEIASLPRLNQDKSVLVRGRVVAQDRGHSITLRDEAGQLTVLSAQTLACPVGAEVEALGKPDIEGTHWRLREASYRLSPRSSSPASKPGALRLAAQLAELSPEQAAQGLPVFLSGVITWSHPDSPFLFLQDSSGGVCVYRGTDPNKVRPPGRSVEVSGVTALGEFAPVVTASNINKTGDTLLPEASNISLEHALGGTAEAQWVEMRGLLLRVSRQGAWDHLELTTTTGRFTAILPASEEVKALVGAALRIQGVCNAETNPRRQIKGIRLWVPALANLQIEQEAPTDVFAAPQSSLASIGQFGVPIQANRRVRISGTVLYHDPGHALYLHEEGESLLVFTNEAPSFSPGDRVDAVGFLSRQGFRYVMREAVCRWAGAGRAPEPAAVAHSGAWREDLDGRLVSLDAVLNNASTLGYQTRLTLNENGTFFEAFLPQKPQALLSEQLPPGSGLRLTGVYELKFDENGQPAGFQILLRNAGDIKILSTPSWFTRGRILAIAATLLVGILLFLTWILALRRQVRHQTEQLRAQLEKEAQLQAELQRASKLESLGLLAGGIAHDFNNLLTVVMGNLSLTSDDPALTPETRDSLRDASSAVVRARDLTQQLLTFAKGGAPLREATNLSDVIREVAQFSIRGSLVALDLHFAPDLKPADVDKGQISQVVQNLVINALQAMPEGGTVRIDLRNTVVDDQLGPMLNPGDYIELTISDTGPGIAAEHLGRIFDPYFTTKKTGTGIGLATVHSIVRKHSGHISVSSTLGKGSSFRIWLPAASAPAASTSPPPPPSRGLPTLKGRVLVMDDEPEVRRLVCAILRRLGLDCTTAAEGSEAVRLYQESVSEGRPFDLLILDLTVPGGFGGLQVMEQLRPRFPGLRAIVSSGYSAELSIANYRDCGFLDVVPKPYEIGDLARVLGKYLIDKHPRPAPKL